MNKDDHLEAVVAVLAAAKKVATPGEWFLWTAGGDISSKELDAVIFQSTQTYQTEEGWCRSTAIGNANRALVVLAVNHLDELLAAAEKSLRQDALLKSIIAQIPLSLPKSEYDKGWDDAMHKVYGMIKEAEVEEKKKIEVTAQSALDFYLQSGPPSALDKVVIRALKLLVEKESADG